LHQRVTSVAAPLQSLHEAHWKLRPSLATKLHAVPLLSAHAR
jgi:hypothetical protein